MDVDTIEPGVDFAELIFRAVEACTVLRMTGRVARLDQACGQGQPSEVGAAAAAGLVPDPAQV